MRLSVNPGKGEVLREYATEIIEGCDSPAFDAERVSLLRRLGFYPKYLKNKETKFFKLSRYGFSVTV